MDTINSNRAIHCEYSMIYITLIWLKLLFQDFYGNKDLAPGGKSLAMLDNVVKQLKLLPPVYADFYARRVVQKIQDKCYLKDWFYYFFQKTKNAGTTGVLRYQHWLRVGERWGFRAWSRCKAWSCRGILSYLVGTWPVSSK